MLKWRRRISKLDKHGRRVWEIDSTWIKEMVLEEGKFLLIHPDDEKPHATLVQDHLLQYQHGNVLFSGEKMSVAFVFRVVTQYCSFFSGLNRVIISKKKLQQMIRGNKKLEKSYILRLINRSTMTKSMWC